MPETVVRKALEDALLAPNSSNLQPWEFHWVRSPQKKATLIRACLSQSAARTAAELVVAVSRIDTWNRNRRLMLEHFDRQSPRPPALAYQYYRKLIPVAYAHDPIGLLGLLRRIAFFLVGFLRPIPRQPASRGELFEVVTKTTALACENFMLSIVDQGYACCPMEGFDSARVRRLLGLNRSCHVVMVIGLGEADPAGLWGEQVRFDPALFVHEH